MKMNRIHTACSVVVLIALMTGCGMLNGSDDKTLSNSLKGTFDRVSVSGSNVIVTEPGFLHIDNDSISMGGIDPAGGLDVQWYSDGGTIGYRYKGTTTPWMDYAFINGVLYLESSNEYNGTVDTPANAWTFQKAD